MNNYQILKSISGYKHYSYGNKISLELVKVFRIKNLLLFAFKLLQKYEQVTQTACSQIKKNVLLNQLHLAEQEIRRLDAQIKYWTENNENVENILKELRQKFTSLSNISLPSGLSKIDAFCQIGNIFDNDIFVNCDDIFHKNVNDTKLTEAQFVLFPQKLPVEYYKDLIYLQMHFNLLLVQGFNFALPLLTTRFSFLNRIIYWPHRPRFGFLDRSKDLNNKLSAIKVHVVVCLKELIKAIAEVEKWILFCLNSYDFFNTYMKAICIRKKDLYQKLHKLKFQYRHFNLEHNRLVGAIAKADATFFERHPYLLVFNTIPETSITSPEQTPSGSFSAFSKSSFEDVDTRNFPKPTKAVSLADDSVAGITSEFFNFNFLPSLYQSGKSKLSSESKSVKDIKLKRDISKKDPENLLSPIFKYSKNKSSIESMPPKTISQTNIVSNRSIPRLSNVFSSPSEKLYCNCVTNMPSVEDIRKSLLNQNEKSDNQNNQSFASLFYYLNNNNFTETKYSSMRNKMNYLINNIKFDPKFKRIDNDMNECYTFLNTLSHQDDSKKGKINFEETVTDRAIILNLISTPFTNDCGQSLKNKNEDYHKILNSFLYSCGYQNESEEYVHGHLNSRENFPKDLFHSLDLEQSELYKSYVINSMNKNEGNNPIIYNEESNLMESLKLYSKYAL